jgi:hypothetical protein
MGRIGKSLSLVLILIISLTIVGTSSAQNTPRTPIPVPKTPDFTIEITNSSYYVPVTYSVDPYNGQEIANNSFYSGYVDALNATITIKNQLLALSTKSDHDSGFKYFIEVKNHSSTNWAPLGGFLDGFGNPQSGFGYLPSSNAITAITFQFSNPYFPLNYRKESPANSSGLTYAMNPFYPITVAHNETVDFRVRAGIGDLFYYSMGQLGFHGSYSDWNQLTITMTNGETPVPEFSWLIILPFFAIMLFAVLLGKRKVSVTNLNTL